MTTPDPTIPRTVVALHAENFKRLKAVDITPEPGQPIVTISGANAQGKSSVLDALWSALESSAATKGTKTTRPVRDGEKKATVRVDLGDIIVTRTWTAGGTSKLEVTPADGGAAYKTPQKVLDSLLGRLTFDPLAFTRMSDKDQVAAVAALVDIGIDLDAHAAERAEIYQTRTSVGRDRKALGDIPAPDDNLPTAEVSAADVIEKLREAQAANAERDRAAAYAEQQEQVENQARQRVADLQQQIADLQQQITDAEAAQKKAQDHLDNTPEMDTDALGQQLADLDQTNAAVRENNARRAKAAEAAELDDIYNGLTSDLAAHDQAKADALAAAHFPLPGLSLDTDGITYNGVPFSQASAAEQLRVSCALAAASAPSVRVMRVTDGSLLDTASRQALADLSTEYGMQAWVEVVEESGQVGVVIEDGEVKDA